MNHLTLDEQSTLRILQQRRLEHWQRLRRRVALRKAAKHGLMIAACLGGLLFGEAARAEDATSAVSAPALFDDGNAAQRTGQFGPAILDYERARLLAPHDPSIAKNLQAAREKAGVTAPQIPPWQRPAHGLSFNALTALASISLLLFSVLFFGTRFIPATLRGVARGVSSALGIVAVLAAATVGMRWPELNRAVVVGSQPAAHLAPAQDSATTFELKPGELVRAEDEYGAYIRVRADDGKSGWVSADAVRRIIPKAS